MKKLLIILCLLSSFIQSASLEHWKYESELIKRIKIKIECVFNWAAKRNHDFRFNHEKSDDYKHLKELGNAPEFKEFDNDDEGFLAVFLSFYRHEPWYCALRPNEAFMNEKIVQLFREYKNSLLTADNNSEILQQIYKMIDAEFEGVISKYGKSVDENKYNQIYKQFHNKVFKKAYWLFRDKNLSQHLRTRLIRHISMKIQRSFKRIKKL